MASIDFDVESLEIKLLLQVLKEQYGTDFLNYRTSYLVRRLHRRMELDQYQTITELTNAIIHNPLMAHRLIRDMSINVTDMFRFPQFFERLKLDVFPLLKTYPSIRIWIAGCASGEEVLSLAIFLSEAGLLSKTRILATDINEDALNRARQAMYPIEPVKQWSSNYIEAGGTESFYDYCDVKYNQVKFDESLLEHVTFEYHDLTTDVYPKGFHVILCRNVLIYFNQDLQKHVLSSFHKSLLRHGYLGLGDKEHVSTTSGLFDVKHRKAKVFIKK